MNKHCIATIIIKSIHWNGESGNRLVAAEPDLIVNGVPLAQGIRGIRFQTSKNSKLMRPDYGLEMMVEYADYLVPKEVLEMIQKNKLI